MFEDNEYLKRVRDEFGMSESVQVKIDKILGKKKTDTKE
jgi:hypothetical protein